MLLYCDSFDHYTTNAHYLQKGWANGSNDSASSAGNGRNGTASCRFGAYNRGIIRSLGGNYATLIAGLAYRFSTLPTTTPRIISFMDGASQQIELVMNGSRQLAVTRDGTLLETGTTVLVQNSYYYIEFRATIANAGAYEVRINGVLEFDGTADTQATANAYANNLRIGSATGTQGVTYVEWDDLYVCDDVDSGIVGAPNDDFLGDCRVDCLFPNANGTTSDLLGSDGNSTDNYLLVDEATPDDDTTYVESAVITEKDTYNYSTPVPTSGVVYGVQAVPLARKTDAGTRTYVPVSRLSTTEEDGDVVSLSTSYLYYPQIFEADPNGDIWTLANLTSAEFGFKVNS